MSTPKRRATDHTPQATNPTVLFYGLVLAGLLGIFSVVFSTISIAEFKQDVATEDAIASARNTVEIIRHRKRAEEHTECIVNYMYEIIQAKTVEERRAIPRCPPEDMDTLNASLQRAKVQLKKLDPKDPILQEADD